MTEPPAARHTPFMIVCLLFAALGAIVPWYFNIQHFLTSDVPFTPVTFVQSGMTSPMSSSLTTDFFIGSTPVVIWMVIEGRRLKMKWGLYLVGTFGIAFAFACPLFLYMRERRLQLAAPADVH